MLVFSVEVAVAVAAAVAVVVRPSVALHVAALVVDADAAKLADIPTSRCDLEKEIVSPHPKQHALSCAPSTASQTPHLACCWQ